LPRRGALVTRDDGFPEETSASDKDTTTADSLAWENRDTEIEYTCPGFGVRRDDVTLPDGTETDYHYVDEPPAVVILPFTEDGDVVVIEEWRQAVGRVNRGIPAGTMERADGADLDAWLASERPEFESVERAARRELTEETGYEADEIEPLVSVEPSNGIANSLHNHVVAHGCTPTAAQDLDHDESIRVTTEPFETLHEAVLAGEITDGRTVIAVHQFAATKR
jgi:ADP-ribose pyrophosphatase